MLSKLRPLWVKPLSPELLGAYQSPPTELLIQDGSDWVHPVELAKDRGEFVVITSDNPFSRPYSESRNQARRQKFLREVQEAGLVFASTRARNIEGIWPDELGIALWGVSPSEVQRLSRRWGQYAYYLVSDTKVNVVVTEKLGLFGRSQKNRD